MRDIDNETEVRTVPRTRRKDDGTDFADVIGEEMPAAADDRIGGDVEAKRNETACIPVSV